MFRNWGRESAHLLEDIIHCSSSKEEPSSKLNDFPPVALTSHLIKTLDFTSPFTPIQLLLLQEKLIRMRVDLCLVAWISSFLNQQISVCQAEGHHIWHCGQQHRSSAGDGAVPPPLHSAHSRLLLQLWNVSHPVVHRWHSHHGVYQRQWRGGIQEPSEELCYLVPHKQPAAQHLRD